MEETSIEEELLYKAVFQILINSALFFIFSLTFSRSKRNFNLSDIPVSFAILDTVSTIVNANSPLSVAILVANSTVNNTTETAFV